MRTGLPSRKFSAFKPLATLLTTAELFLIRPDCLSDALHSSNIAKPSATVLPSGTHPEVAQRFDSLCTLL